MCHHPPAPPHRHVLQLTTVTCHSSLLSRVTCHSSLLSRVTHLQHQLTLSTCRRCSMTRRHVPVVTCHSRSVPSQLVDTQCGRRRRTQLTCAPHSAPAAAAGPHLEEVPLQHPVQAVGAASVLARPPEPDRLVRGAGHHPARLHVHTRHQPPVASQPRRGAQPPAPGLGQQLEHRHAALRGRVHPGQLPVSAGAVSGVPTCRAPYQICKEERIKKITKDEI